MNFIFTGLHRSVARQLCRHGAGEFPLPQPAGQLQEEGNFGGTFLRGSFRFRHVQNDECHRFVKFDKMQFSFLFVWNFILFMVSKVA